jgi:hypothetical protein
MSLRYEETYSQRFAIETVDGRDRHMTPQHDR